MRAQQIPVIGFLNSAPASDTVFRVAALRDGLADAGFIEGHNVTIEFRWADHQADRLPALAADLVQRGVAVMIVQNATIRAVRDATSTIPIVFVSGGDPISSGLVTSLSRPDGNVTGVSFTGLPLQPKRLDSYEAGEQSEGSPLRRRLRGRTQRSRWSEGRGPRGIRTSTTRTGPRARLA